jgi:hypothetical protein
MSLALHPRGVGIPDWPPPFEYALPDLPNITRTLEPFIAAGFTDDEAWEALFDDEHRLARFRTLHGNRPKKRRR